MGACFYCSYRGLQILFVDDYTRYSWIYPLTLRSEVKHIFPQFHTRVKSIQSDIGGEFLALKGLFADLGIKMRLSWLRGNTNIWLNWVFNVGFAYEFLVVLISY